MKFDKKEPEIKIQPFNAHKNLWARCICMNCAIPYTTELGSHFDEVGNITPAWHGQNINNEHLWQCANCVYQAKESRKEKKDG